MRVKNIEIANKVYGYIAFILSRIPYFCFTMKVRLLALFYGGTMKKGEIYDGVIEKVDFPNRGCVNIDGERVIVKNGILGQKVRFMINKKRSGRAEGRLHI